MGNRAAVRRALNDSPESIALRELQTRRSPLHLACQEGDPVIVELMVAAGADVKARDWEGWTPLHNVGHARGETTTDNENEGYIGCAQSLLTAGADINARDMEGYAPAHIACLGGHIGIAAALLADGADFEARNDEGETPLDILSQVTGESTPLDLLMNWWNNYQFVINAEEPSLGI